MVELNAAKRKSRVFRQLCHFTKKKPFYDVSRLLPTEAVVVISVYHGFSFLPLEMGFSFGLSSS
jgi:hypothetical protein